MSDIEQPAARVRELEAQLSASLLSLAELVAIVRHVGGYTSPEHQEQLRHARALLAAAERSAP